MKLQRLCDNLKEAHEIQVSLQEDADLKQGM